MDRFKSFFTNYKCWCCESDYEGATIHTDHLPLYITEEIDRNYSVDACPICAAPQPKREKGWYEYVTKNNQAWLKNLSLSVGQGGKECVI